LFSGINRHLKVNLLVPEKFGFGKGIPTTNAVFTLTDNILTAVDQWKQIGCIFYDLAVSVIKSL